MNNTDNSLFLKRVNNFVMIITIIIDIFTICGYMAAFLTGHYPLPLLLLLFAIMILGITLSFYAKAKKPYDFDTIR